MKMGILLWLGRMVHHRGNLIPLIRPHMWVLVAPVQSLPTQAWELRCKVVGEMRNFRGAGGNMMQGLLLAVMPMSQVVD